MKLYVYCVFDKRTLFYRPPICAHNDAHVARSLMRLMQEPVSEYGMFPKDYDLYRLGSFEDKDASLVLSAKPEFVLNLGELQHEAFESSGGSRSGSETDQTNSR